MTKLRTNITISPETKERLLQYARENHLRGGVSGAIEHMVWHAIKVYPAERSKDEDKKLGNVKAKKL